LTFNPINCAKMNSSGTNSWLGYHSTASTAPNPNQTKSIRSNRGGLGFTGEPPFGCRESLSSLRASRWPESFACPTAGRRRRPAAGRRRPPSAAVASRPRPASAPPAAGLPLATAVKRYDVRVHLHLPDVRRRRIGGGDPESHTRHRGFPLPSAKVVGTDDRRGGDGPAGLNGVAASFSPPRRAW
jgi:hypothetical protein